ncbi:MAG: hypothetical protein JXO22_00130 [Phycisphaerae bacterium]|nr:hypothetical protein [Phycisphaerae bacterium]
MLRKINALALVALISVLAANVGCDDLDSMLGDGFRMGNFNQGLDDLEYNPARSTCSSCSTTPTSSYDSYWDSWDYYYWW